MTEYRPYTGEQCRFTIIGGEFKYLFQTPKKREWKLKTLFKLSKYPCPCKECEKYMSQIQEEGRG